MITKEKLLVHDQMQLSSINKKRAEMQRMLSLLEEDDDEVAPSLDFNLQAAAFTENLRRGQQQFQKLIDSKHQFDHARSQVFAMGNALQSLVNFTAAACPHCFVAAGTSFSAALTGQGGAGSMKLSGHWHADGSWHTAEDNEHKKGDAAEKALPKRSFKHPKKFTNLSKHTYQSTSLSDFFASGKGSTSMNQWVSELLISRQFARAV